MTKKFNPVLLDFPTELRGERVLLRPFRDEDVPALWEAVDLSRQHLRPWMPWVHDHIGPEFSREYVRKMQARWTLCEDFSMGVWRHSDGRLLGASGLHRIDWSVPVMESGYWLRPDAEGKGYVTEAVRLLVRFAFDHLRAERLEIRCDTNNLRSAGVPRRVGFTHEATLRCARRNVDNELGDTMVFAMTRKDFETLHG